MSQQIVTFILLLFSICISLHDINTHKIENWVHPTIMFLSLFVNNIPLSERIIGLTICFFPIFFASLISRNRIGMGDAKLLGSFGFMLGTAFGYISMMFALVVYVIFAVTYQKIKHEKKAHPLAPFICGSSIIALLLEGLC